MFFSFVRKDVPIITLSAKGQGLETRRKLLLHYRHLAPIRARSCFGFEGDAHRVGIRHCLPRNLRSLFHFYFGAFQHQFVMHL